MNKNKNELLIFAPSIEDGGVEKNLFNISNFLAGKIRKVSVVSANKNKNKFVSKINFICPKNHKWDNSSRLIKSLIAIKLAINYFSNYKNKFVILSFNNNLFAIILAKLLSAKIIIRSNTSVDSYLSSFFKKKLFQYLLNLADKIIVNSKSMKTEFKKVFNLNPVLIYNPIENKNIIQKKAKQKIRSNFFKKKYFNILTIGRLVKQKDQITLIKSLEFIESEINYRLLIIGNGEEKIKILNLIKSKNLQNKVKIIEYQNNIYPYIKRSDIFVLTSKYEGLPNVLIECLALKKIVVSTNCKTGPSEILNNGKFGKLIKVGDYKKLGQIISDIKNNYSYYNQITKKGYKSIYRFNFQINCEKYLKEIKKFL